MMKILVCVACGMFFLFTGIGMNAQSRTAKAPVKSGGNALARELYNDYLDALPNKRALRESILRRNFLAIARKSILRDDTLSKRSVAAAFKASDIVYQKVDVSSAFVRGFLKEIRFVRPQKFMYVLKIGSYMIFCSFIVDPGVYITAAHQAYLVKKRVGSGRGHENN